MPQNEQYTVPALFEEKEKKTNKILWVWDKERDLESDHDSKPWVYLLCILRQILFAHL